MIIFLYASLKGNLQEVWSRLMLELIDSYWFWPYQSKGAAEAQA